MITKKEALDALEILRGSPDGPPRKEQLQIIEQYIYQNPDLKLLVQTRIKEIKSLDSTEDNFLLYHNRMARISLLNELISLFEEK